VIYGYKHGMALIIHGAEDSIVPIQQGQSMVNRLREAGVASELKIIPGKGHGWPAWEQDITYVADWFDRRLQRAWNQTSRATVEEVDFSSDQWRILAAAEAQVCEYKEKTAMRLTNGCAFWEDLVFEDGVIECDIASPGDKSYVGIVFRMASPDNYELIYFQPHSSGKWDAIQYDPVMNGSNTWQLHHGPSNQAVADVPSETWFHVKIVVSGLEARVFLNHAEKPALVVPDLQHGYSKGHVGFWSYYPGNMANLAIKPLPPSPRPKTTGHATQNVAYLTKWLTSEPMTLEDTRPEFLLEKAIPSVGKWQTVTAESSGIVNLNRHFAKPPGPAVIFVKLNIGVPSDQTRRLHFGYSDKISVFLNAKHLYAGDNSYRVSKQLGARGYVKDGEFTVDLPLEKGDNELILAVSELAFGWGFIAKLDSIHGLSIQADNP